MRKSVQHKQLSGDLSHSCSEVPTMFEDESARLNCSQGYRKQEAPVCEI